MIEISDLRKSYQVGQRKLEVLKGINLNVPEGELAAIMGSSGTGKSTLLNILGILDNYDSGTYKLNGTLIKDLSETKSAKYRNEMIGFVFQSFNLVTFKNAVENVALPLYYQGVSRSKRNKLALEYLDRVGLADWADHLPSELSGGQQQRVAIARALVSKPKLILADEPTGALDTQTSNEVMNLLKEVSREGMTMIIVTHDPEVSQFCDRMISMKDGLIENSDLIQKAQV
ncbi:MAG: putative ABC transport system ATP-binding protein [Granulosicoccus sp.]|jgi:putative ABC transport system ATP-binding protein